MLLLSLIRDAIPTYRAQLGCYRFRSYEIATPTYRTQLGCSLRCAGSLRCLGRGDAGGQRTRRRSPAGTGTPLLLPAAALLLAIRIARTRWRGSFVPGTSRSGADSWRQAASGSSVKRGAAGICRGARGCGGLSSERTGCGGSLRAPTNAPRRLD
jgi:hypothetical protein